MLKVKLGKSFYINIVEFRGFISLHTVMSALEELTYDYYVSYSRAPKGKSLKELSDLYFMKYSICIGHPYKTFKEAYKNCSKICDGETERTFKVEIYKKETYPSGVSDYICYFTDCSFIDKKRWERIEIKLDADLLKTLFRVEVVD